MAVYHTATQEDYDALMVDLEEKGYKWNGNRLPTNLNHFEEGGVCVYEEDDKTLSYGSLSYARTEGYKVTEYKAKKKSENETVNKPSHYIGVNGMEVEEVLQEFLPKIKNGYVAHRVGSAVEYLLRAYSKNDLEDIEKAKQNLEQIINYERKKIEPQDLQQENELNSFLRSLSDMPKQDNWVDRLVPGMKVSTYYAGTNPLD